MDEEFVNITKSLDTLTIAQVAEKIHAKDSATARKWLIDNGIKIYKFPSHQYVYAVEVDSNIDKPFVKNLRAKCPDKWKDQYRDIVKDMSVYKLTLTMLEDEMPSTPSVKVSKINKKDEERYKKFSK